MLTVGQELRVTVGGLAQGRVQHGDGGRRAPSGGNAIDRPLRSGSEEDGAVGPPARATRINRLGQGRDGAAVRIDLPELSIREETDCPAVRREERAGRPLGAVESPGVAGGEIPHPEPVGAVPFPGAEDDPRAVRRDGQRLWIRGGGRIVKAGPGRESSPGSADATPASGAAGGTGPPRSRARPWLPAAATEVRRRRRHRTRPARSESTPSWRSSTPARRPGARRPGSTPPSSAIHCSCSFTSCARLHAVVRVLGQAGATSRSSAGGVSGASCDSGARLRVS